MKYKVLTRTLTGLEDCWAIDGEPQRFDSVADAETEIAEHIADCQDAADAGDMTDAPTREDFKIVPE